MILQKRIALLGSTGSIGVQALDIIKRYPEHFTAHVLTARKSADVLIAQALEYKPVAVVLTDQKAWERTKEALSGTGIQVLYGENSVLEILQWESVDLVLNALVGFAGLEPSLVALKNKKTLALANKESLVAGGHLIMKEAHKAGKTILPVDSEHSAIFQCLLGEQAVVEKMILTASGGPFFAFSAEELETVTKAQALAHPTWNMGSKVTVDSATLMNKGLEVMEAFWLFGQPIDRIEVIIHPQAFIHSMVQFTDGVIKAQMGYPDMRLPILFAFSYPRRMDFPQAPRMNLSHFRSMEFYTACTDKFPCLSMAYHALRRGGNVPCVLNAANEIAVEAFLSEQIRFTAIPKIISGTLERVDVVSNPSFSQLEETHTEARRVAQHLLLSC